MDLSICGIDCSKCEYVEELNCKGCRFSKGDMNYGICEIAKCALGKDLDNCSDCNEFVCDLLKSYSFDPEHGDNGERINNLEELRRVEN